MNLMVNELIKYISTEECIERILWIDEGNLIAFTIDIYSKNALPKLRRVRDIIEGIDNKSIIQIKQDPFVRFINEESLGENYKQIRDKAWKIIEMIAGLQNEPKIYYGEHRGKYISQVMEEYKVSKNMIYKYLRRYWQRGKVKNALLPDYDFSGAPGNDRIAGVVKRGRPRKSKEILGNGINVDEQTKKIFRIAINRYYHTDKENSLRTAYTFMVKEFYAENYNIENGLRKVFIQDINTIPSLEQFRYWYEKENNIKKKLISRKGDKKYQLNNRAIMGKSDYNIIGPGSKYQIDATVADVYLVSRINRNWIIGRPVMYIVIDVFSRMVTGLYIGLEGPSWIGAMMALSNTATSKVQYCKEFGIEINDSDWPCHSLPEAILADRGEMESSLVDTLINSLHVKIENTPPYRADWKGIVEQYFKLLDTKVKPVIPGHIDINFRERGGKDYRLDAKLDIYQFTKIIINCILSRNNKNYMDNYIRDEEMLSDGIEPIPNALWQWGISHRSGSLRSFSEDIVKLNLMPRDSALVTAKGIKFKNMYYSCHKAIEELWFENARNKGSWKLDISYDPRNMNYIYIRKNNGREFEKCELLDERRYLNKTLEEIIFLDEFEKFEKSTKKGELLQSKVDLYSEIEGIVSEAEKMTNEQSIDGSKSAKIKGIRDNRRLEKDNNRNTESFELGDTENVYVELELQEEEDEDLLNLEYLRQKQKERLYGEKA